MVDVPFKLWSEFPDDPAAGVPGFRMKADGGTQAPGSVQGTLSGPSLWGDVRDTAEQLGTKANAVVNGAYSVFPGVYNAARAVSRGVGFQGSEEFRRFGQEADFAGGALTKAAEHPEQAYRAGRGVMSKLDDDPLFRYYMAGRALMGVATGLGPAAMAGDALRALETGHDWVDAFRNGVQGKPPTDR